MSEDPHISLLSSSPLVLLVRNTLTPEMCADLLTEVKVLAMPGPGGSAATLPDGCCTSALEHLGTTIKALAPGAVLHNWQAHGYRPIENGGFPNGLHVDTIGAPKRCLTALLYLTSPKGGETVFPLAHAEPGELRQASLRLLSSGILHTRMADGSADAALVERCAAAPACGIRVSPTAGDLLLFVSAQAVEGGGVAVDPLSWHGSAAAVQGWKWTLQNFMELPAGLGPDGEGSYLHTLRTGMLDAGGAHVDRPTCRSTQLFSARA